MCKVGVGDGKYSLYSIKTIMPMECYNGCVCVHCLKAELI